MIEQMSIFDYLNNNKYINNSKLKLLSLFSGIGAFEKALDNLGVDYELVNYCEIDKYASKSYSLIHNVSEDKNLWDVTKVDTRKLPKDIDLITYGFPCQDISLAGKQQGLFNEDGSKTRSGLFFEALRIIEDTKPKFAIAENVKNLVSKKFKNEFEIVLKSLEETGYNNYYQVLNAKDYGIPQNRERVFIVSIRKDIDKGYTFPKPLELKLRLKDMLEDEVDEKYYLSDNMVEYIIANNEKWTGNNNQSIINKSIASTINTGEGSRRCDASNYICDDLPENFDLKQVGQLWGTEREPNPQAGRIYDPKGISPTIASRDGNKMPKILVKEATKKGYDKVDEKYYLFGERVDKFITRTDADMKVVVKDKNYSKYSLKKITNNIVKGDVVGTITANAMQSVNHDNCHLIVESKNGLEIPLYKENMRLQETIEKNNLYEGEPANLDIYNRAVYKHSQTLTDPKHNTQRLWDGFRIRKLTPKECWRLMGFADEDCEKSSIVNSNTQLYKQAGNSIVVNVLEEIFKQLL